ncbi:MAG: ABC transporter substrate-binding protein [Rhodothermia bacterium]|nr:MAG: ABC transporter substrate-binding protein [Rhodothermia bacterium]
MHSNSSHCFDRFIWIVGLIFLLGGQTASAQSRFAVVATIARADSLFAVGLNRFTNENYVEARSIFHRVVEDFDLHRNTTAAFLMMAKSAYRMRDFGAAEEELDAFLQLYPSSGYRSDARSTRRLARKAANRTQGKTLDIGIILSLYEDEVAQTQALFNGIRVAVEEFNQSGLGDPIKMIFRDTNSSPARTAETVRELADKNVRFILGALFSDQAIAAAEAAEREKIVFVAPLATDERVGAGRKYAFQANASIKSRGRLMARFAVLGLQLDSLGVIARVDESGISERLTDAFIQEASELGAKINLVTVLSDDNAWVRLSESITADTLEYVDAVYIPVTDMEPEPAVGAILSSLDRLGAHTRILGNSSWHDLPMVVAASRYTTTYSNDYYLIEADSTVESFKSRFAQLSSETPQRLAYTGYDVTRYLLSIATRDERLPLDEAIRREPLYRGLALRIEFQGTNVNGAMFFHRYRDDKLALIR